MSSKQPLIVIVGPTASGKTGLSIALANQYGGEIISADSRAVYRGMDIGSAKPTSAERQGVAHWGFDLVRPGETFTAAEFKQYAEQKINEIRARGHIPIIVGGTGLYVDAVLFNYNFPVKAAPGARKILEKLSLQELHEYCTDNNIALPENALNKRYVINTILHAGHTLKRNSTPRADTIVVGIATDREVLRRRISERTVQFLASGVIDEALQLAAEYGWDNEAMTGNIYPLIHQLVDGEINRAELEQLFNIKEWHLAKRQMTWFKRNEHITWLPLGKAYTYLAHTLD